MKPMKMSLVFAVCLLLPAFSSAQTPKPIYVDAEGRIFLKSKTPLFLHLTNSTQANAPTYLLRNQSSQDQNNQILPFRFEGHGTHTIKHVADHRIKQKNSARHMFRVYDDGRVPKTEISNSKAPSVRVGKTMVFGKTVQIFVETTDLDSGVNAGYFALNSQEFAVYGQPLNLDQEADYVLKTYAVDNVGNTSKVATNWYAVDLTPPETTRRIKDHKDKAPEMIEQNILSPIATISLSSEDAKAGVKRIGYKLDGRSAVYSGKPLRMKGLAEGEHTLVYAAQDRVGNVEADVQFTFYLDRTSPEIEVPVLIGDVYEKDNKLYVSGTSTIELTATDNKAGVRRIRYNFKSTKSHFYAAAFGFPQRNGTATFYYAASDKVINVSSKENQVVVVDISSPDVTASFIGKHFLRDGIHYIRKTTGISMDARDNLSGIKDILYDTQSGSAEAVSGSFEGQPFMILDEGLHDFTFRAIDNVNNVSEAKKLKIFVDEVVPEIFYHFSVERLSGEEEAYSKNSSLFLAATDRQAGVKQVYYRINKGRETRYKSPIKFGKKGSFKVMVRSIDHVGNESEREIVFAVR